MRFLLAALILAAAVPAQAARDLPPLTPTQESSLKQMAASMKHQILRAHERSGDRTYAKPDVTFDPSTRQIVITNRLNVSPGKGGRKAIAGQLRDRRASMCAVFASKRVRNTGLGIVLRAEMRSGSLIARETASGLTCN